MQKRPMKLYFLSLVVFAFLFGGKENLLFLFYHIIRIMW